jgi:heme oxygenase
MAAESRAERIPLPLEIHAATRQFHTALNRLITSRLPLCLPSHATTPARYATGIATFGQIYIAFEEAWDELLASGVNINHLDKLLRQLRRPSLLRSTRLKADLSLLHSRLGVHPDLDRAQTEERARLMEGIRQSIFGRPHLLLSYVWIMYMALFNGGRWIRDQLIQAGPEFWGTDVPGLSPRIDCLSFWDFEGESDVKDVKTDLKAKFNTAAATLSEKERHEVIDESVRIFEVCSRMVAWLDEQDKAESQSWPAAVSSTVSGVWARLLWSLPSFLH